MKSIGVLVLAACAVLVAGCAPPADTPEQMIAAAKALDQRFLEAYNSKDVDAAAETYWNSPDLVSYPPGVLEARGFDAVKKNMIQEFTELKDGTLEFMDASYQAHGDVVVTWGTWRFTMPGPDGTPIEVLGRYTDVKARRDGKWVYIHDHASAPMMPQEEP